MERAAAVAQRGLPAGAATRSLALDELARALATPLTQPLVYVYTDSGGRLTAAGEGGAARAVVSARLAPHPPAATAALLLAAPGGGGAWRLRLAVTRALAPHDELLLWPEPALLALCGVPFLTLHNITEQAEYVCHLCGARYSQPNPLKLHLLLACSAPAPRPVWRALLARLAARPPAPPDPHPAPPPPLSLCISPPGDALESLATAWGARGAAAGGGHACLYCGKRYSRRYGLKIHIRTHTGYKPLRCAHCARRFGDPSNLNKHVRLHARALPGAGAASAGGEGGAGGAARHQCARCGAQHARRRDLQRHERTRHPPAASPALPAG